MIRVATREDIPQINEILNEPSVKEGALFPKDMVVDAAEFFDVGFTLMANGGCFICIPIDDESLDVHTNFLPEFRGDNALKEAKNGLRMVITQTSVTRIFTKVHQDSMAVRKFARWAGFEETLRSDNFIHYILNVEKFIATDEAFKAIGSALFPKAPEASWPFLGFVEACADNSIPWKGATLYNRLAVVCGWDSLIWDEKTLAHCLPSYESAVPVAIGGE